MKQQEFISADFTSSQLVASISKFISLSSETQEIGTSIEDIENMIAESKKITILSVEKPLETSLETMVGSIAEAFAQHKPISTFRLLSSVMADANYLVSENDMKAALAFFQQLPEAVDLCYAMGNSKQLEGRVKVSVVICS